MIGIKAKGGGPASAKVAVVTGVLAVAVAAVTTTVESLALSTALGGAVLLTARTPTITRTVSLAFIVTAAVAVIMTVATIPVSADKTVLVATIVALTTAPSVVIVALSNERTTRSIKAGLASVGTSLAIAALTVSATIPSMSVRPVVLTIVVATAVSVGLVAVAAVISWALVSLAKLFQTGGGSRGGFVPHSRTSRFISLLIGQRFFEHVFRPIIADAQYELVEATQAGNTGLQLHIKICTPLYLIHAATAYVLAQIVKRIYTLIHTLTGPRE